MKSINDRAVSPVVGVMLMIVVVIIIAAIASAFAGSAMAETKKTPQANIKATFSTTRGMEITNAGGDTIPTQDLVFEMTHDPSFGSGLDAITATVVNRSIITDINGSVLSGNMRTGINLVDPGFKPGDTLFITTRYINPTYLQPQVAPCNRNGFFGHSCTTFSGIANTPSCPTGTNNRYFVYWDGSKYFYDYPVNGGGRKAFWDLCFANPDSVGKTFTLTTLDKRTNGVISKNIVTITS